MSKGDFQRCVELISSASGLLVTAGAGMGVACLISGVMMGYGIIPPRLESRE